MGTAEREWEPGDDDNDAACPVCTAACTYEAMTMCARPERHRCPVLLRPASRTHVDATGFASDFLAVPRLG